MLDSSKSTKSFEQEHHTKSYDEFLEEIQNHVNGRVFNDPDNLFEQCVLLEPYTFFKGLKEHKISIQASKMHYCTPRANVSNYTAVEIMILTNVKTSQEFQDKYSDSSIYSYVPITDLAYELYEFVNTPDESVCGGCGADFVTNSICNDCKENPYPELTEEDKEQAKWYYENFVKSKKD